MRGARGAGSFAGIAVARRAGYLLNSPLPSFSYILSRLSFIQPWLYSRRLQFLVFLAFSVFLLRACVPYLNQPDTTSNAYFFFFFFLPLLSLMVMRGRRRIHFSDVESPRGHDEMISFECLYRTPSS
jgi:hypothetical protein